MLRNLIAVIVGLLVAAVIIALTIKIDSSWIQYDYNVNPYAHWQRVINTAVRPDFFIVLLLAGGLASIIGGIATAIIVKNAKQAYAVLIGFLLFLFALADILKNQNHPTFYEIGIFFVFFPFSWLGGEIVVWIYRKFFKKDIAPHN